MAHTFVTIPGSEITTGDVLKRLPGVAVLFVEPADVAYPHAQMLYMADGSLYFIDPEQVYVVARPGLDIPAPASTVLVVGPTATGDERDTLRGHSIDIAEQTGAVVTYALHTDYTVTDFGAVHVWGRATELRDAECLVLVAEALAAGMDVFDLQAPDDGGVCGCGLTSSVRTVRDHNGNVQCWECSGWGTVCAHCAETGDFEEISLVEEGQTISPVHTACLEEARQAQPGEVFATV